MNNFVNYIFCLNLHLTHYLIKYFLPIGLLFFFLNKQKEAFIFLFIFLLALSASFLKLYPFGYRVGLYLIPVTFILIAKVIDFPALDKKNILIFLKSVLIACLIFYLTNFYKISYSIEGIGCLMESKKDIYNFYNCAKNILPKVNKNDIIIASHTMETSLIFYNNYLNENKTLNIIIYDLSADNKEEAERKLLKTTLDNYNHSSALLISGLEYYNNWDISSDNNKIVEDELKKHNLKYTKTDDNSFYIVN